MNFDFNKPSALYLFPLWIMKKVFLAIRSIVKTIYCIILYGCELFFDIRFNRVLQRQVCECIKENKDYPVEIVRFSYTFSVLESELRNIQTKYGDVNFLLDSESLKTLMIPIMQNLEDLRAVAIKGKMLVALKGLGKLTFDQSKVITNGQYSYDRLQHSYELLESMHMNGQRFNRKISKKLFIQKSMVLYLNDRVMMLIEKCQEDIACMIQKRNDEISRKSFEVTAIPGKSCLLESPYVDTFDHGLDSRYLA